MIDLIQLRATFTALGVDVAAVDANLYEDRIDVSVRARGQYQRRDYTYDHSDPDGTRISRVGVYEHEGLPFTSFGVAGPASSISNSLVALVELVADVVRESKQVTA